MKKGFSLGLIFLASAIASFGICPLILKDISLEAKLAGVLTGSTIGLLATCRDISKGLEGK